MGGTDKTKEQLIEELVELCRQIYGCKGLGSERKWVEKELLGVQSLESIGILAGGIANTLNNILTVIMGNISLAKIYVECDNEPEEAIQSLKKADIACMRVVELTQKLLTFHNSTMVKHLSHKECKE